MNKYLNKLVVRLQRQQNQWWLLACAIGLVYMPFLGSDFFFDDLRFFGDAAKYYATSLFQFNLRWFPYASLGWSVTIFSDVVPHFFHLGNALLHFGNVLLLFYLLRQLLGVVIELPEKNHSFIWGAWLAALLFAVHPVAVYAVGYVIQRSILMATFFALVMQVSYLRALLSGQKRWLILSVLAYFMAGFSKEHSVLMPAVLLALHVLLRARKQTASIHLNSRALWSCWGAFAAIGVLLVLRTKGVLGSPYEPMAAMLFEQQGQVATTPMLYLLSILTQAGLFFKYLLLWLLPNPAWMSVDMREQFISGLSEWQGWVGGLAYLVYGLLALRLLLRGGSKGLVGFALLYPWLLFPVEFVSIRVQEPFVLYRSYLWMPGMMLLLPLLLRQFSGRRTFVFMLAMVLLLIPLSWNRLWVFADNFRLWDDAAVLLKNERVAGADRIYFNRAQAEMAAEKWEDAALDFERSAAISPQLGPIHFLLGVAYTNLGRYEEALVQYDIAIAIKPDDGRVYYAKGMTLKRLHRDKEAALQMEKSCELQNMIACMIVKGKYER